MNVVLTIAGSDSSGGAGIQADLKSFEAFGLFGCSVLTVLTAQNTTGVSAIQEIEASFVKEQLDQIFKDFEVGAIKIGMLFSNEIINTIREYIKDLNLPIVIDPVFISKAGSKLLSDDAIENMKTLFPYATIITPNLYEAKALFDYQSDEESQKNLQTFPFNTVIKNEHVDQKSIDTLITKDSITHFESEFLQTENTHGTGCSFSSAIAANLALGKNLEEAIAISKRFVYEAIRNAPNLGHGKGPIAHKKASQHLGVDQ